MKKTSFWVNIVEKEEKMVFDMFSVIDIVLGVILLVSLISGGARGLLKSIGWLPGLVFGFLAVKFFSVSLAELLASNTTLSPLWSTYIAVIALMGGTYLVIRIIALMLSSLLEEMGLGAIDKIFGALFSLALALLILGLMVSLVDNVEKLSLIRDYISSSWIIDNIIRPFFSGTASLLKEAI